jgi:signal recognition particle subunit SRP54
MVLAELGSTISKALHKITQSVLIDDSAIDAMLKEICAALIMADVNIKLIKLLKTNIKANLNFEELPSGINKRNYIKKVKKN